MRARRSRCRAGAGERRLKSYPTWSPDGRHLYYCSASTLWGDRSAVPPVRYAEVKYDLMRIGYDVDKDEWTAHGDGSFVGKDGAQRGDAADLARRAISPFLHVPLRVLSSLPVQQ